MAESPDRPRDDTGRPRNARPRDITGAPLPPGTPTPWRERLAVQDREEALPADDALVEAERLILGGAPFYAHEVLEGPWHLADEPERRFWQGLAQVAVGLTHVQRGNPVGAVVILRRAADNLDGYADGLHGVGTPRLARTARQLAGRIEAAGATDVLTTADLQVRLLG